MKRLLPTIIFTCFFIFHLSAQNFFYNQQHVSVWSKSGLILRQNPSRKSPKIKSLPYGTELIVKEQGTFIIDSVLVISAYRDSTGEQRSPAFFLQGYWVFVVSGQESGYVFSGYLSAMKPFRPHPDQNPGIQDWLRQTAGVLDSIHISSEGNYTKVYKNHVVEHGQFSEGGGTIQFTFQHDMSFQDGFLLLNYFENLHISKQEIAECESFELKLGEEFIESTSIGLRGGIAYTFRIRFINGLLIVMSGGGC